MKRRRIILIVAAVALPVIVLLALAFWPGEKEPEYQGKKLSWWLDHQKGGPAVDAVKEIGTNALPLLVKWIDFEPASSQDLFVRATRRFSPAASHWLYQRLRWKVQRQNNAIWAFMILGPRAAPAIPDLLQLVQTRKTYVANLTLSVLGQIGDAAVPIVFDVLTNGAAYPHIDPRYVGGVMEGPVTNKAPLVPVLISCLSSTNHQTVVNAVTMLGSLHAEDAVAVPALVTILQLQHEDVYLRYRAVAALERFGPQARPAIPALAQLHHNTNATLRNAADHALGKIAPEVFTNGMLEAKQ